MHDMVHFIRVDTARTNLAAAAQSLAPRDVDKLHEDNAEKDESENGNELVDGKSSSGTAFTFDCLFVTVLDVCVFVGVIDEAGLFGWPTFLVDRHGCSRASKAKMQCSGFVRWSAKTGMAEAVADRGRGAWLGWKAI